MIEDDSQEEIEVSLTKVQLAALLDKARMSKDGWRRIVGELTHQRRVDDPRAIPHAEDRAPAWAEIERRLAKALGDHGALKKQKKLAGMRRL